MYSTFADAGEFWLHHQQSYFLSVGVPANLPYRDSKKKRICCKRGGGGLGTNNSVSIITRGAKRTSSNRV